ncbi:MAG: hypothetical protein FLDDKLPJ_00027 [Phycisphaerae bacterium]|nr:hypothetical protein [Phycisphaerae bacterium]
MTPSPAEPEPSPVPRSRRRRRVFRLAVAIAALMLADQLAGVLLIRNGRFRGRPVPPYQLTFNDAQRRHVREMTERWDSYTCFDPELGWSIRPGGVSDDGRYRANAAGFRADRDYDLAPPPGVLRVAALGESFTHAATGNADTWCACLERMNPALEALNFGVNGYGLDQALLRYRRDAAPYRPHVVILGLMVENLLRHVSVYRPAYHHDTISAVVKPRFRIDDAGALTLIPCPVESVAALKTDIESEAILNTLRTTDYWIMRAPLAYERSPLFASGVFRLIYAVHENAARDPREHYLNPEGEPFRVTLALVRSFNDEARRNGARRVILLLMPDERALFDRYDGLEPYWEGLLSEARNAGVETLDVSPRLLDAMTALGVSALFSENHYTPLGNRLVAEELLQILNRENPGAP